MSESTIKVIPHLCCRNATEAYEFYQKAFGASPMCLIPDPSGKVMHAAIEIGGFMIFLHDEYPEHGALSPLSIGGTSSNLHLQVPDSDASFKRAVDAGCKVIMPVEEQFWGDRYGLVEDPYGHRWAMATTVKFVSPDEIMKSMSSEKEAATLQ